MHRHTRVTDPDMHSTNPSITPWIECTYVPFVTIISNLMGLLVRLIVFTVHGVCTVALGGIQTLNYS